MRIPFPFKFIHAADLHLDSPFRLHEGQNETLRRLLLDASIRAFARLCDVAIDNDVDFVILAGDVYDGIERGARAQLALRRQLLRLESHGIMVYIAFGNHDPIESSSRFAVDWPENVVRFPVVPERFAVERNGTKLAEITGVSYQSRHEQRNLASLFPMADSDSFAIAVLHANIGNSQEHGNYAPASLGDLITKGYDYWALGHIHKRSVLFESPLVIYPGNIQGLHMKPSERGPKGAELVEVAHQGVSHSFIPLSEVIFEMVRLDVTGYRTLNALVDGCVDALRSSRQTLGEKPLVVRIDLTGILEPELYGLEDDFDSLHQELESELADLDPPVFLDQLDGHLLTSASLDALVELSDVVGELIDLFRESRNNESALTQISVETELRSALSAKVRRLGIAESLPLRLSDLDAAERLLFELLNGGSFR